jgi:hypothetical protein
MPVAPAVPSVPRPNPILAVMAMDLYATPDGNIVGVCDLRGVEGFPKIHLKGLKCSDRQVDQGGWWHSRVNKPQRELGHLEIVHVDFSGKCAVL